MKIISKFKDYYDSVAWTYGGGDPKIRYERREIEESVGPFKMRLPLALLHDKWRYSRWRNEYLHRSLVVGDRIYAIFSRIQGPYFWFLPDEHHEIVTQKMPTYWRKEHKGGSFTTSKQTRLSSYVGLWVSLSSG